MDDARNRRTPESESTASMPSAYYSAALLGVAAFLLLFVLFPEPIRQYTAQIELEQTAIGDASAIAEAKRISQADVNQIAESMLPHDSTTAHYRSECVQLSEACTRVRIEIDARHANDSVANCQAIADQLIASQPTKIVPRAEEQRSLKEDVLRRLSLLKDSESAADDELAKLEREHVAQSLALMREQTELSINRIPQETVTSDVTLAWQAARGRMQELENRRAELLVTRTEAHPHVQEVNLQIAQQRAGMSRLPTEATADVTIATPDNTPLEAALQTYQARSAELAMSRNTIRSRRAQLEQELVRLTPPVPSIAFHTAITTPVAIVERAGGRPTKSRLTIFMAVALLAACGTFYITKQFCSPSAVRTLAQIRQELGLEVYLVLNRRKLAPPALRERDWLRNAVFSAELFVLLIVLGLVFAFSSVSELSQSASEDPFGVVAEALDRVGETPLRR